MVLWNVFPEAKINSSIQNSEATRNPFIPRKYANAPGIQPNIHTYNI